MSEFHDGINIDIDLFSINCPECGENSLAQNPHPDKCPHCGIGWRCFGDGELKPKDEVVSLVIDRISGHVTVLPFFVGAIVEHKDLPAAKLRIVDGPWKTPLGNTQYVVAGKDGKKWAVKKENLKTVTQEGGRGLSENLQ